MTAPSSRRYMQATMRWPREWDAPRRRRSPRPPKSTLARLGEFFGLGMDQDAKAEKAARAKERKAARRAEKAEGKSQRRR